MVVWDVTSFSLVCRYQHHIAGEHSFNIDCCKNLRLHLVCLYFQTVNIPFVIKVKDGTEYLEYQSDDVQDNVYLAVLQQSYKMFRLFKGSFTAILSSNGADVTQLKQKLDHFFSRVRIKYFFLTLRSQEKFRAILHVLHILTFPNWLCTII
jgi:hypothetical protein